MKLNRNDPCRCGSGKKYKKCCADADDAQATAATIAQAKAAAAREPAASTLEEPAAPGRNEPLGEWMHQSRPGKSRRRHSQVGKDSLT